MRSIPSVIVYLLVACAGRPSPEPEQQAEPEQTVPPSSTPEFLLIDVDELPNRWTPAEGWTLAVPTVVGDLTGDGVGDAVVYATPVGSTVSDLLVVAGPLRRSLTLPGDEAASMDDCMLADAGDATGDGRRDLWVYSNIDNTNYLVPGPVSGAVSPAGVGTVIPREMALVDIDGDGILDRFRSGQFEVQITWGPSARWGAEADLTVLVPCPGFEDLVEEIRDVVATVDLDGDGLRQLWLADGGRFCTWVFPLPTGGVYDPTTDPAAAYGGILEFEAVPDQTGDGLPDLWTRFAWTLQSAVVTFGDGQIASDSVIAVPRDLQVVHPIPYDVTGDGLTDFIAVDAELDLPDEEPGPVDRTSGEVLLVLEGGAGLANPTATQAWAVGGYTLWPDASFVEEGMVGVLVSGGAGVVVIDLGSGVVP